MMIEVLANRTLRMLISRSELALSLAYATATSAVERGVGVDFCIAHLPVVKNPVLHFLVILSNSLCFSPLRGIPCFFEHFAATFALLFQGLLGLGRAKKCLFFGGVSHANFQKKTQGKDGQGRGKHTIKHLPFVLAMSFSLQGTGTDQTNPTF